MFTSTRPAPNALTRVVHIAAVGASLTGELSIPRRARGIVVFSHTNRSGLASQDTRRIANALLNGGYGVLIFDLLTPDEEIVDAATLGRGSDRALLARRLIHVIDWLASGPNSDLPIGIFGEDAGAAAALVAACVRPHQVCAVASYAERPDLASPVLGHVRIPVLLVVRAKNDIAVRANEMAFTRMHTVKELVRIGGDCGAPGRDGTLDELARVSVAWFDRHLAAPEVNRAPIGELC